MRKLQNKKAFSLIELSIVILIIGIIVAGVTQSSRLISAFRLSSARSQTQSSPVVSIKDVVAWWDATSESAFTASEADNGLSLTTWYDTNPQSSVKKNIAQSGSARPTYLTNGIGNLPAVDFNISNSQFFASSAYDADLNTSTFTMFFVVKPETASNYRGIVQSVGAASDGYTIYLTPSSNYEFWFGNGSTWVGNGTNNTAATLNKSVLLTIAYDKNASANNMSFYKNTTTIGSITAATSVSASLATRFGSASPSYHFDGQIGEIIIYSRVLKAEERQAIQNYLIKKWGIT